MKGWCELVYLDIWEIREGYGIWGMFLIVGEIVNGRRFFIRDFLKGMAVFVE